MKQTGRKGQYKINARRWRSENVYNRSEWRRIIFAVLTSSVVTVDLVGEKGLLKAAFIFPDVPILHLSLGSNLNPDDIEEGDDVYFECKVNANPWAYKVLWKHNVSSPFLFLSFSFFFFQFRFHIK